MSKRIFDTDQINILLANKNILRCSTKSITYTTAFKVCAIKQYNNGLTATEVFTQAGLDPHFIGKRQPRECMRRWRKIVKEKGNKGLCEIRGSNSRGRQKKPELSESDRVKRLEAEVIYLRAENDFLAKLRAKRAE